jgi:sugar-specific transcriptional regulator TrmB
MFPILLKNIGFNEKEAAVYQAVLELGRASAGAISKACDIPRATVYGILENLKQRGVIVIEAARGSTYYCPGPPASFTRLLEKEKEELEAKEQVAKQLAELVASQLKPERSPYPKIRLAEGRENVNNMLYDLFTQWRHVALQEGDTTVWGYQDASFVEEFAHFLDWRWKTASEQIYFFSNLTLTEQKLVGRVPGRYVRPLPGNVEFVSSIYVFGKHHVMLVASREKPVRAFLISEPTVAANLQAVFRLLWQLTEKR